MPNISIIYDSDGWAFHHQARAIQRHTPPDFEVSIAGCPKGTDPATVLSGSCPDLLLWFPYSRTTAVREILQKQKKNPVLVICWSIGWPRDFEKFPACHAAADWTVFNNRVCWEHAGSPPRSNWVANGVDLDTFTVTVPIEGRQPKVLWAGSQLYRSIKGYDDFILPLRRALARRGIGLDARLTDSRGDKKLTPQQMADWYNTGTVYVCASELEGTPNTALEAAACGCTVVSTRVGNMTDLIRSGENGYLVDRNIDAMMEAISTASENYTALANEMTKDIQSWGWQPACEAYFNLFRDLCAR